MTLESISMPRRTPRRRYCRAPRDARSSVQYRWYFYASFARNAPGTGSDYCHASDDADDFSESTPFSRKITVNAITEYHAWQLYKYPLATTMHAAAFRLRFRRP